jgi:ketosteroid isomerase-like protein
VNKKDVSTVLQTENKADFFKQVIEVKDLKIKETLLSFDIKVDGAMAIAWAPYRMTIDGKLNHCGVNVFTLIKRTDNWKIMGITDTRRKQGCE